jgi:predicted PurR-regulated permease PerM
MNEKAPRWLQDYGSCILTTAALLALAYFGRHGLIPLALAIMISLLMAPGFDCL